jgi:DNA-binding NarL/FixJ family response regulator
MVRELTAREKEVAALIAKGFTNKEIGKLLNISHRTVEVHRDKIRDKAEIFSGSKSDLIDWCRKLTAEQVPSAGQVPSARLRTDLTDSPIAV